MLRYTLGGGLGPFLIRSVAGSGAVRIAAMAASFAVGVQLARMLGVEGYGYYGIALSIVTLAGIPGELGLPRLVTREVAVATAHKDPRKLFGVLRWADRTAIALTAIITLAVVSGALALGGDRPSGLTLAILLSAPMIPLLALSRIRGGALQGLSHIVRGQIPANLLRPLLMSALLFAAYLLSIRIDAPEAMALNSVTALAAFVVAAVWLRNRLPEKHPPEVVRSGRKWLASTVPMALADGMRSLQAELTILVLAILAAAADVGLFRIAVVTAAMAAAPLVVVNRVAFPVIARLHAESEHRQLQKVVTAFSRAQFGGVLLLSLPLFVAAGPLLRLVFGDDFGPAAPALVILAAAQVVNGAFGPNVALLNMTHHERRVTRAMGIALGVNLIGVAVLGSIWGLVGAAAAFAAGLVCWNVLTWLDARRLLGVDTFILPRAAPVLKP